MSRLPDGPPGDPLSDLIDAHADRPDAGILHAFVGSLSALVDRQPSMPIGEAVTTAVKVALDVTLGDRT